MGKITQQVRPGWCQHPDCLFVRQATNAVCGGNLPESSEHDGGFNYYRVCLRSDGEIFDFRVNDTDLDWFRWIFDALDGKKTSWLSKDVPG